MRHNVITSIDCVRGTITQLDPAEVKAKAKLPDMGGIETDWLPVMQTLTKAANSYTMPRIGQQVYIIFMDEHATEGVIIGGRYSKKSPPPNGVAQDDCYLSLEDGTKIHIKPGEIHIETPGDITLKAAGDLTADVGGSAAIKTGGAVTVEAGGNATIKASQITLDAPLVKVTGNIETQDVISSGKSFLTHKHTSSQPGTPTTPPI
jgi:phage baseplate assembly protein V